MNVLDVLREAVRRVSQFLLDAISDAVVVALALLIVKAGLHLVALVKVFRGFDHDAFRKGAVRTFRDETKLDAVVENVVVVAARGSAPQASGRGRQS